jgi:uncharacterized protein (DUF362 family)
MNKIISRRRFLRQLSACAAGLLAAGCLPPNPPVVPTPASTATPTAEATPTSAPTATQTAAPTATSTAPPSPTQTTWATATSTPAPTASPALSRVAIAQVRDYERDVAREGVRAALDGLGGLGDVIRPGDRVAIKPNLTGGTGVAPLPGVPAVDSFATHPEVVRALGEALRDAGAGQIYIVEAVYQWESFSAWGYEDMAAGLGATLIDLNAPHPYGDFISAPVGEGWYVYPDYTLNPILGEMDVFVSVAKMKCHWSCGVTLSLKNLIGLVPVSHYRCGSDHVNRSDLHGCDGEFKTRLPGVIVDLNRVRPIHLAVIDGIKTVEAGEGPWIETMAAVAPGVLVAGKNPVATDAVAMAVMGFDPGAAYLSSPFLRGDNHLNLASEMGLGTHRPEQIDVVGAAIEDVRYEFTPCWQ